MNEPIDLAPVHDAWERYASIVRQRLHDPKLLIDRAHMEASILAFRDFQKLFLASQPVR